MLTPSETRAREARERPIIFSAPMVKAILAGRKTQTRRVLKPQPPEWATFCQQPLMFNAEHRWVPSGLWRWSEPEQSPSRPLRAWPVDADGEHYWLRLRHAKGDRLWVKEGFARVGDNEDDIHACPDLRVHAYYRADDVCPEHSKWRSPIFMPRWASRLTLEVTEVRVERLQDISREDAIAEGCIVVRDACNVFEGTGYHKAGLCHSSPVTAFGILWDDIHGPDAWDANPWVVAVSFQPFETNIDRMPERQAAPVPAAAE